MSLVDIIERTPDILFNLSLVPASYMLFKLSAIAKRNLIYDAIKASKSNSILVELGLNKDKIYINHIMADIAKTEDAKVKINNILIDNDIKEYLNVEDHKERKYQFGTSDYINLGIIGLSMIAQIYPISALYLGKQIAKTHSELESKSKYIQSDKKKTIHGEIYEIDPEQYIITISAKQIRANAIIKSKKIDNELKRDFKLYSTDWKEINISKEEKEFIRPLLEKHLSIYENESSKTNHNPLWKIKSKMSYHLDSPDSITAKYKIIKKFHYYDPDSSDPNPIRQYYQYAKHLQSKIYN